ncbi:MAG: dienelactone hydrolase [Planctomycetota bacterium]|nr:MAG: dienelactone hydrolase [Planctomycetota bacterium]
MITMITMITIAMLGLAAIVRGDDDLPYDPLLLGDLGDPGPDVAGMSLEIDVRDDVRSRTIPLRIWLPADHLPAPVILFSHGLGGSRDGNAWLGRHWSGRGYCVVFLQHAGSDEAVWRDLPFPERLPSLKAAVNRATTLDRYKDLPVVIDRLGEWNSAQDGPLAGRFDLARIGIAGHSFGAVTAQGVTGQRTPAGQTPLSDPRIRAAVLMSPSVPDGCDAATAFGGVVIPWMILTGTDDESPIGNATAASRLEIFPALPPGGKYELVLADGEHQAFGDRILPGSRRPRNPNHHRVVRALSTAFFDAFLRDRAAAREWLEGDGPRGVLEQHDRWQFK